MIKIRFLLLCYLFLSSADMNASKKGVVDYQLVKAQEEEEQLINENKADVVLIETLFPDTVVLSEDQEKCLVNQYYGRVLLLHFWATWCPPCRSEFESIQLLQNSFDKDQFVVAAISHDVSRLDIADFLQNKKIDMSIYFDSRTKLINQLFPENNGLLPISILVDKKGKMVDLMIGVQQWSSQAMLNKINNLVIQ